MPKSGDMEDQSNPVEYQAKGSGLAEAGMFEEGERALNDAVARVREEYSLSEKWIPPLKKLKLRADALRALKLDPDADNPVTQLVIVIITSEPPHNQGPTRIFYMTKLQPKVEDLIKTALQTHYSSQIENKIEELSSFLLIEPRLFPLIRATFEMTTPNLIKDLVIGILTDKTTPLTYNTTARNRFEAIFLMVESDLSIKTIVVRTLQEYYSKFPKTNDDKQQLIAELSSSLLLEPRIFPFIRTTFEMTTPNLIKDLVIGMLTDKTTPLTENTTARNRFEAIFLMVKSDPSIKGLVVSTLQTHYSQPPPTDKDKQELYELFLLDKTMASLIIEIFGEEAIQECIRQLQRSKISMTA